MSEVTNSEVTINAGKIKGDYCEYQFSERTLNGSQSVKISSEAIVHDDLRRAFRSLVPHLAFVCDYIEASATLDKVVDDMSNLEEGDPLYEELTKFKVTAFKMSGMGESQGVVITGQRRLEFGGYLYLTTPVISWDDDYQYVNELRIAVSNCQSEILQYSDGKKAPDVQAELFGEEEDNLFGEGEDL